MFGLRNLVPRGILNDQNYNILKKRSDQYKRSINYFTGHIHQMVQIYLDYYNLFQANLHETMTHINSSNKDGSCQLFSEMLMIFCQMNGELQKFIEKTSLNEKSLIELSNIFITDYEVLVETFQKKGREYFQMEEIVISACKKYFGVFREILNKIQAYKTSFMDVKLIYNNDQKVRLYKDCLLTYKEVQLFAKSNQQKVKKLNDAKFGLIDSYKILEKQLSNFTISFASRYVEEMKKFFQYFEQCIGHQLQILIDKYSSLEKSTVSSFLEGLPFNTNYQKIISTEIKAQQCRYLPSFIVYNKQLTAQGMVNFRRCMFAYLNQVSTRIEGRKKKTRKMVDMLQNYVRGIDKNLIEWIKGTLSAFDKMRHKIGESFGSRWIGFYKIIAALFQNSIQNTGRLVLRTNSVFQKLEKYASQESNLMNDFLKELRSYVEQNVPKKFFRKYSTSTQTKAIQFSKEQLQTSREHIFQMSQFLIHLLERYQQASSFTNSEGKTVFVDFMTNVKQSLSEYFIFANELQSTYYNEEDYLKSYKLFQEEMSESVKKGMTFFQEIPLAELVRESIQITFESEFNKIEGFRKIKKPKEFEEEREYEKSKYLSDSLAQNFTRQSFVGENNSKNADFLFKRLELKPKEKYIKSYSCSLSDKIILAGRLFITTHRLCFYSKFNTKNIFFGGTFIDIPSEDIKKIEKRSMNVFSDHALGLTTVNGQIVFRSFFSRDNCYNIIKKTFEVNKEDIFFEEDMDESRSIIEEQIEFEDDMKEEISKDREERLEKILKTFDYQLMNQCEFQSIGLTVVKFLKIFELDQEIVINRVHFSSFLYYFKDLTGNKDICIDPWTPNPLEYLNVVNIKEDSPEIFSRKVQAVAPLPSSPIPFMPKTSLTKEEHTLFLMSKNKVVIESVIMSTGVPYSDTFDVRIKRVIQSVGQNKVKVSTSMFLNFFQSVLVRSTIESKSFETTSASLKLQNEQIASYLKFLEKKMLKGAKRDTPEQKIRDQELQIQQLQADLIKIRQSSKDLQQINNKLKKELSTYKNVSIILAVLLLMSFLILIS